MEQRSLTNYFTLSNTLINYIPCVEYNKESVEWKVVLLTYLRGYQIQYEITSISSRITLIHVKFLLARHVHMKNLILDISIIYSIRRLGGS